MKDENLMKLTYSNRIEYLLRLSNIKNSSTLLDIVLWISCSTAIILSTLGDLLSAKVFLVFAIMFLVLSFYSDHKYSKRVYELDGQYLCVKTK